MNKAKRRNRQIYNCNWGLPFPAINSIRQKIIKNIEGLSNTISQQDLINISRQMHIISRYALLSSAHTTQTISQSVKLISADLKEMKSYRACSLTIIESNQKSITKKTKEYQHTWKLYTSKNALNWRKMKIKHTKICGTQPKQR